MPGTPEATPQTSASLCAFCFARLPMLIAQQGCVGSYGLLSWVDMHDASAPHGLRSSLPSSNAACMPLGLCSCSLATLGLWHAVHAQGHFPTHQNGLQRVWTRNCHCAFSLTAAARWLLERLACLQWKLQAPLNIAAQLFAAITRNALALAPPLP